MLTARQLSVTRALLAALAAVPEDFLLREDTLRADAARMIVPRATAIEIDEALLYLEQRDRIAGLVGETGAQWQITAAGRLWLAQNR